MKTKNDWPEEVIAVSSKGKREVRVLLERGVYARYTYIDPETRQLVRKGKGSVWLRNEKGGLTQLFMIPLKDKYLTIENKERRQIKVWDPKQKRAVDLFG